MIAVIGKLLRHWQLLQCSPTGSSVQLLMQCSSRAGSSILWQLLMLSTGDFGDPEPHVVNR